MKSESEFVRRGFDIQRSLYDLMRVSAVKTGLKPKEWLANAIRNELIARGELEASRTSRKSRKFKKTKLKK